MADRRRQPGRWNAPGLESVRSRDDLERRIEEAFEQELLAAAMEGVRARVEPGTWEAFRLTAVVGLSGGEAARVLGRPVGQVFVAKHRVQRLLRAAVGRLGGESDG